MAGGRWGGGAGGDGGASLRVPLPRQWPTSIEALAAPGPIRRPLHRRAIGRVSPFRPCRHLATGASITEGIQRASGQQKLNFWEKREQTEETETEKKRQRETRRGHFATPPSKLIQVK